MISVDTNVYVRGAVDLGERDLATGPSPRVRDSGRSAYVSMPSRCGIAPQTALVLASQTGGPLEYIILTNFDCAR